MTLGLEKKMDVSTFIKNLKYSNKRKGSCQLFFIRGQICVLCVSVIYQYLDSLSYPLYWSWSMGVSCKDPILRRPSFFPTENDVRRLLLLVWLDGLLLTHWRDERKAKARLESEILFVVSKLLCHLLVGRAEPKMDVLSSKHVIHTTTRLPREKVNEKLGNFFICDTTSTQFISLSLTFCSAKWQIPYPRLRLLASFWPSYFLL